MKLHLKLLLVFVLVFVCGALPAHAEILTAPMAQDGDELDPESLEDLRQQAWDFWRETMLADETLKEETENKAMTFGDATMRYTVETFGEMPDGGYPLYIAMHGGGSGDTPDLNDSQWEDMQSYYTGGLDCGVYGLIEYMILTENVNPNRVYLTGFSAGGDGVYAIGARMADRFAAANMSSGHPNSISMVNYYHLPIQLQAGESDTAYDRHLVTAEYDVLLDELQSEYEDGYEHRTLIHKDRGHNYEDYDREPVEVYSDIYGYLSGEGSGTEMVDSYAPDWLDQFTRDPLPAAVRWDLGTRAELRDTDAFYYLSADEDAQGIIQVYQEGNYVLLAPEDFDGNFRILFNEDMIDFSEPVHFELPNLGELDVMLVPEEYWLSYTTFDRGDPYFQFEAAVSYDWLLENLE